MQSFYQIIITASKSKVILVQTMKGYERRDILTHHVLTCIGSCNYNSFTIQTFLALAYTGG